jgi:hypothetical protein
MLHEIMLPLKFSFNFLLSVKKYSLNCRVFVMKLIFNVNLTRNRNFMLPNRFFSLNTANNLFILLRAVITWKSINWSSSAIQIANEYLLKTLGHVR